MDNSVFQYIKDRLFNKDFDIQIKVFNILALGGIMVCALLSVYGLVAGETPQIMICYLLGVIFSITMLHYTIKTGKYEVAMTLTVLGVFIVIFTFIFFNGGGYHGGAPVFFVFAMVFTAFLLRGKAVIILVAFETAWYTLICLYAYFFPQHIRALDGEWGIAFDVIICVIVSGISLSLTMYLQMRVYRKKQQELTLAKEAADVANNAKSDFLAKMSHDIRTPINTVMAMNELISQNSDSEDIIEWANDSVDACTLLLSLLNDLLDISKIEAGKVDIRESNYQVRNLIHKLYINWNREAVAKGLSLQFDVNPKLPSELFGCEDAIYKILSNYISNALKYSDKGTIQVSIDNDGDNYIFRVKDQGIGVPQEFIDKIFMPFERGAQDYYHSREGSGLGLAIVKELADKMSAQVICESELGEGSCFSLIISQRVVNADPIGDIEDYLIFQEKDNILQDDFVIPGSSILVVDDNFYNRKVLRALLEPVLAMVDDVESGEEAIEMLDIKNYDLVLMDYRMPDMSGEETLKKIHENIPGFDTPVVVITADAIAGTREKLLNAGFDDYISKPVNSSQLKDILKIYIADKLCYIREEDKDEITVCEEYRDEMEKYDISVDEAMEINGNRVAEWLIRLEFFLQYYESNYNKIKDANSDEELDELLYTIHSLKSSAKGIGAITLSQMAGITEKKANRDFTASMIPAILREYELVCNGCRFFYDKNKGGMV